MGYVSGLWKAARPFSLTVSFFPPILGSLIAVIEHDNLTFNWLNFILVIMGCLIVHAGVNMFSDYFDFKRHVDRPETYGGSRVLLDKDLSPKQLIKLAVLFFSIAMSIGLYFILTLQNGLVLLWPISIGAVLGLFYTFGPISLKYHAFGDLGVFIAFGSAMTAGAYFVQTNTFSWGSVFYAIPMALLVDAILHSNNLRDIEYDKVAHIKTLAMILGSKAAKKFYYILIFGAYVSTVLLVFFTALPSITLVVLLSLPIAWKRVRMVHNKDEFTIQQFAAVDAMTAQLHMAFSLLFIGSLFIHHVVNL